MWACSGERRITAAGGDGAEASPQHSEESLPSHPSGGGFGGLSNQWGVLILPHAASSSGHLLKCPLLNLFGDLEDILCT